MASKTYQLPRMTALPITAVLNPYSPYIEQLKETLQGYLRRVRAARRFGLRALLVTTIISLLFMASTTHSLDATNVQAQTGDQTTSRAFTPISSSAAFAQKGINIGNDQSSTRDLPYRLVQNENDLALLKGKVSRIRIALAYGLDVNDVNNLKRLAIEAKQQGFYVQFGITAGADAATATYYNQWLSKDIVAAAVWAQAHHIDEFAIGNEEDWYCQVLGAYTTKTPKEVRDDIRNKVADVRKVYSGSIIFSDAEGTLDDWIKEGIGGLDRIYFNVYDTYPNFEAIIHKIVDHFGTNRGGLAEWAAQYGYDKMSQDGMSPQAYAQEITKRTTLVRNSGLPAYLFTLRTNQNESGWGFLLEDGTKRPGIDEFLAS